LTKKDIEFLNHFQEDNPNWEMIYEDKKNKVYDFRSEWNYFPNVEFIGKTYVNNKIQITFDYPLQKVAYAIFGNYKNQDPFVTRTRISEYKHNDHVIIEQNSVMAAFQEPRIKKIYYAMEYDPEAKRITSRGKPYQADGPFLKLELMNAVPKKGEKEQKLKCLQYFTFYTNTLTQIDENRTLFEQTVLVDVGGAGFPKGLAIKRAQGLFANFSKTLENMEKNTTNMNSMNFGKACLLTHLPNYFMIWILMELMNSTMRK
jgi:hypothetical protein